MRRRGPRSLGCLIWVCLALASADEAKPYFLRGMIALHNFEYEEANEAFRQARTIDPGFALAYWGEAMTYYQVLWRNENVDAARRALVNHESRKPNLVTGHDVQRGTRGNRREMFPLRVLRFLRSTVVVPKNESHGDSVTPSKAA